MITRRPDTRRDAPALRFLGLCVAGWIALRALMTWNPVVPPPSAAAEAPNGTVRAGMSRAGGRPAISSATPISPRPVTARLQAARDPAPDESARPPIRGLSADRDRLRQPMIRPLPPSPGGVARSVAATGGAEWFPVPDVARAARGQGNPFWIRRQLAGWSLGGWLYLRNSGSATPEAIAAAGQLGGSQAGLRLGFGFGETGRARTYGRATIAVRRPEQREVALGLAFAPLPRLPVDIAIEQRIAAGKEGRTALAAMATGGVSEVRLPVGFRFDAYAQAGVVGIHRRDGFADGAVVVDRRLGANETSLLRVGALAAGAVQPRAARVDVGPRLTLRLPDLGKGSRIALDWRQRIVGDAHPESGLALTLASDF